MTGMSGNDSRAAIAKETGLAEATLAQLGVGQFYVKVGNRPAFRLDVPAFLIGNRHALSWEDWHGVKEHQLDAYYRVIPTTTADSADVRGSDPSTGAVVTMVRPTTMSRPRSRNLPSDPLSYARSHRR